LRRLTKIAAVVAVASMALAGCGSDGGNKKGSSASADACKSANGNGPKVGIAYDVGGRGDNSFNDSAYEGVKHAIKDLGATCTEAKAAQGENDTTRAERLRTLAEAGYNPVLAIGFIYSPAARAVAKDYPNTDFGVIDGYSLYCCSDAENGKPLKNLVDLTFAEEQGSFLVGVAAALKSKAKHVGFLGGTHGDLIKKFEAGYTAGVHAVDPSIKVDVKYLTEDPNDGATGFENPAGGKTAAEGLYDGGADIVYHAAGKSGEGLFQAVQEAGAGHWAIGVDSDQYLTAGSAKKYILTSMIKRVDTAVYDTIKSVKDGNFVEGNKVYDLKAHGVGYSKSGGFIDDISSKIDDYATKIESGEIKVPTKP
jgi:basic membrane protein A and related proteins